MDNVVPPRPPAAPTLKPKDMPKVEPPEEEHKEGGFLSKIFKGKPKEEKMPDTALASDLDFGISDDDIDHIRNALGVKDKKEQSIREKFEKDVELPKLEEEDDLALPSKPTKPISSEEWTKPPEKSKLTDMLIEANKKNISSKKKIEIKHDSQKHFEDASKDLEASKKEMLTKAEKKKPDLRKAKAKINTEFKKAHTQLKKKHAEEHKKISAKAKLHEAALKKKATSLDKKAKKLNAKDKSLTERETKVLALEKDMASKEKKINEQAAIMDVSS